MTTNEETSNVDKSGLLICQNYNNYHIVQECYGAK